MPKTEAWWVCTCGKPIYRVGKGRYGKWEEHLPICPITSEKEKNKDKYIPQGMHIKQVPQNREEK